MPITYDATNNIVTVTGYTEGVPCTFNDLWAADKAGTCTLWTGTPTINITLTTQIKPTDEVALKIDFVLAGTSAGAGDTISITGTDKDGNAQTETLDVSAGNGTYTTTKWFKTITDVDCNGFNDGTLTIQQGQWGILWKEGDNFSINCRIIIGNGTTASHFGDEGKNIEFKATARTASSQFLIYLTVNAGLRFGRLVDATNKITDRGVNFILQDSASLGYGRWIGTSSGSASYIYLYSVSAINPYGVAKDIFYFVIAYIYNTPLKVWNCRFTKVNVADGVNVDIFNYESASGIYGIVIVSGTLDKITIYNTAYLTSFSGVSKTVRNLYGRSNAGIRWTGSSFHSYLVNPDIDVWNIVWGIAPYNNIYRQYEFDLTVTDKNNNPINGATVTLKDKDGNTVFTTTTDVNGQIATQTVSRGYYNQANGNTLQDYSPHTLIIEKAGYQSYSKTFTLTDKTKWELKLTRTIDIIFVDGQPALNLDEDNSESEDYIKM